MKEFHCLKSFTTQGLSHGICRIHVARVTCPETSKLLHPSAGPSISIPFWGWQSVWDLDKMYFKFSISSFYDIPSCTFLKFVNITCFYVFTWSSSLILLILSSCQKAHSNKSSIGNPGNYGSFRRLLRWFLRWFLSPSWIIWWVSSIWWNATVVWVAGFYARTIPIIETVGAFIPPTIFLVSSENIWKVYDYTRTLNTYVYVIKTMVCLLAKLQISFSLGTHLVPGQSLWDRQELYKNSCNVMYISNRAKYPIIVVYSFWWLPLFILPNKLLITSDLEVKKKLEDGGTKTDRSNIIRNFMIAYSLLTHLPCFNVLFFYTTASHSDYPTGNYTQQMTWCHHTTPVKMTNK